MEYDEIALGGGCFWCLDAVFSAVRGVVSLECGYSNGQASHPSYTAVCSGATGCVEVVKLRYDREQVSLDALLAVFFSIHDPTTLNAQGNDVGTQYRSGIYWTTAAQQEVAARAIAAVKDSSHKPVVTELLPLLHYWPAEDYHQNFFAKNPNHAYCLAVVAPKVDKLKRSFTASY